MRHLNIIQKNNFMLNISAWKFYKESDSRSSRNLFRFSLIHLPALMLLFLLNKKEWFFTKDSLESDENHKAQSISNKTSKQEVQQL